MNCGESPPRIGTCPRNNQKESWPLLLFLHGAGERGSNLEVVKKHGPPKLIEAGQPFPFIVASPQCPELRQAGIVRLVIATEAG